MNLHSLDAYQFELPEELIAQKPCHPRDQAKLMVVDRVKGTIVDYFIKDLPFLLNEGDSFVFNNTKVIPARLYGKRDTGGKTEILLLERHPDGTWQAMAKPGKKLRPGSVITFAADFSAQVIDSALDGTKRLKFCETEDFAKSLERYGEMPLPHYIERKNPLESDKDDYQTIFATKPGAVAAPTAALHFTEPLMQRLHDKGISESCVTLHVGPGTFQPVKTNDITQHPMHIEHYSISPETANILNTRKSEKKQIVVGTTSCRVLESAINEQGLFNAGDSSTQAFFYPGYSFKYVEHLLTNFHLPGSTLLMLISAFAGYELAMEAYAKAVKDRYRFFSYGDAMLITGGS